MVQKAKSIEIIKRVGSMYPGNILLVGKKQYYNKDGSFTIIRGDYKLILKKTLFKPFDPLSF